MGIRDVVVPSDIGIPITCTTDGGAYTMEGSGWDPKQLDERFNIVDLYPPIAALNRVQRTKRMISQRLKIPRSLPDGTYADNITGL